VAALVAGIVTAGLAVAVGAGLVRGFDALALVLLLGIALLGGLAVAVARRTRTGGVSPARCLECGGLVSASAPYCKHCGAQLGG
jgi:hypothetical protein